MEEVQVLIPSCCWCQRRMTGAQGEAFRDRKGRHWCEDCLEEAADAALHSPPPTPEPEPQEAGDDEERDRYRNALQWISHHDNGLYRKAAQEALNGGSAAEETEKAGECVTGEGGGKDEAFEASDLIYLSYTERQHLSGLLEAHYPNGEMERRLLRRLGVEESDDEEAATE